MRLPAANYKDHRSFAIFPTYTTTSLEPYKRQWVWMEPVMKVGVICDGFMWVTYSIECYENEYKERYDN